MQMKLRHIPARNIQNIAQHTDRHESHQIQLAQHAK